MDKSVNSYGRHHVRYREWAGEIHLCFPAAREFYGWLVIATETLEPPCLPCQSASTMPGKAVRQPWSAEIHLRFSIARQFDTRLCIAVRTGMAARRATTFGRNNRPAARRVVSTGPPACGWLRGTSRTSPGPPCRWRRPVRLRSTSARGRGFAAYLSACGGQPLHRPRCGLRQGGLRSLRSASSLPFLVTCQRQVIPSHSFAARTRACCAPRIRRRSLTYVPRKWYYGLIYMPCKWLCRPTNALPMLVARTPPGGALACAPGSGTLPPRQRHLAAGVRAGCPFSSAPPVRL